MSATTATAAVSAANIAAASRSEGTDSDPAVPMRAVIQRRYGDSSVLRTADVDRPSIGPDEVLVEVHAAGHPGRGRGVPGRSPGHG